MTRSTSELRVLWSPACPDATVTVTLWTGVPVTVRRGTEAAWAALDDVFRAHNYRPRAGVTGAYNCRRITGGTGFSLHAYGIAIDVNWDTNPYGPRLITDMPPEMIADVEALQTVSGAQLFRWGGRYSRNKDAMHFELVCSPAELASGVSRSAVPLPPGPDGHTDPTRPTVDSVEDDMPYTPEELSLLIRAGVRQELARAGLVGPDDKPTDSVLVGKIRGTRDTVISQLTRVFTRRKA